jgi:3-oxoacyl-[acyl-carrier-protein] synthase III
MNEEYGIGVLGVGKYLPEEVITNQQLEEWTKIPASDIELKTGIVTRRRAAKDEIASEMSANAALEAMKSAGIEPEQVGLIVTCTFTGDYVYPAVSCKIQSLIGAKNAGTFDLMANCTGFQVGLGVVSDRMKLDPSIKYAIVIGTALQSRFIDWTNGDSAIYFGDGVGAAVLGHVPKGYGILSNAIWSNGRVFDSVRLRGGGSSFPLREDNINQKLQYYELDGKEVWKQVVQFQPRIINESLEKLGKNINDVNFFIFHQANLRLIEFLMKRMKKPMSMTMTNMEKYGNTADASQAIALCDTVNAGVLKKDDLIVMAGVGAGFIFGSTVIKWH